jgi:dTDP-glucose pyrophosphorylase
VYPFERHLIKLHSPIKDALIKLNDLASDAILFAVDENQKLKGSLTDGDVRRGFIKNLPLDAQVIDFMHTNPKFIQRGKYNLNQIINYRNQDFNILPVVDQNGSIVNVINLRKLRSYLPLDVVIMAGGDGERLKPYTNLTPKPLLRVGDKPIIEHNIDRLILYGIDDFWISLRYLGEQIENYFGDGSNKNVRIEYIWENEPLGTIGAVKKVHNFYHDYILVTNSDILTNLNYEDFFLDFSNKSADLSVVTIPYKVEVPYAVFETSNGFIHNFKEKPSYTYYSNGGIYLLNKSIIDLIPKNTHYNATDLLALLIKKGAKVISYPLPGYWLDIGNHEDFKKAQEDIKHMDL